MFGPYTGGTLELIGVGTHSTRDSQRRMLHISDSLIERYPPAMGGLMALVSRYNEAAGMRQQISRRTAGVGSKVIAMPCVARCPCQGLHICVASVAPAVLILPDLVPCTTRGPRSVNLTTRFGMCFGELCILAFTYTHIK